MIRALLRLLFPRPGVRHRFDGYVPPVRLPHETLQMFRVRQVDAVLDRSEAAETGMWV